MAADGEEVVQRLASEVVGAPIIAAGWFRVFADDVLQGGGLLGLVASVAGYFGRKRLLEWPAHAYWAITADAVWVLEFRFGSGTRVHRVVGTWKRRDVFVSPASADNAVTVRAPGHAPTQIQGERFDNAEREVMRLLMSGA